METKKSLAADSDEKYVVIQARILTEDVCRIQGAGPEVNREYGVALNVESKTLSEFIRRCMAEPADTSKLQ